MNDFDYEDDVLLQLKYLLPQPLTRDEAEALADELLGTDDCLALGLYNVSAQASVAQTPRKLLKHYTGVRQCKECGYWHKGRRCDHCRDNDET
jgi:hypothetical protein